MKYFLFKILAFFLIIFGLYAYIEVNDIIRVSSLDTRDKLEESIIFHENGNGFRINSMTDFFNVLEERNPLYYKELNQEGYLVDISTFEILIYRRAFWNCFLTNKQKFPKHGSYILLNKLSKIDSSTIVFPALSKTKMKKLRKDVQIVTDQAMKSFSKDFPDFNFTNSPRNNVIFYFDCSANDYRYKVEGISNPMQNFLDELKPRIDSVLRVNDVDLIQGSFLSPVYSDTIPIELI